MSAEKIVVGLSQKGYTETHTSSMCKLHLFSVNNGTTIIGQNTSDWNDTIRSLATHLAANKNRSCSFLFSYHYFLRPSLMTWNEC